MTTWQSSVTPARRAKLVAAARATEHTCDFELARGIRVEGSPEHVADGYGVITTLPVEGSFSQSDRVAHAHAGTDDPTRTHTAVVMFVTGAHAVPVTGDDDYQWEQEWFVAGEFHVTEVQIEEADRLVVVLLTPVV